MSCKIVDLCVNNLKHRFLASSAFLAKFTILRFVSVFLVLAINSYCLCSSVPEQVKKEYGADLLLAFQLQSEGMSTHATYFFEQGCMKAMKAGEHAQKIEAIRQLFVWYRTYGYFLKLMSKNPEICGQYIGNGQYECNYRIPRVNLNLNYGNDPERDGKIRDYLMGVTEILSGLLCIWLGPPPYKVVAASLVVDGAKRVWNAGNSLWVQQDISMIELNKKVEGLKTAAAM